MRLPPPSREWRMQSRAFRTYLAFNGHASSLLACVCRSKVKISVALRRLRPGSVVVLHLLAPISKALTWTKIVNWKGIKSWKE